MSTTKTYLRTVTIPARTQHERVYAVTVMLDWHCPACGEPRGEIFQTRSYDGSRTLDCEGWINDCGHTDKYEAVLQEAANNGLNTEPEAKQLEELSINYKNNWEQLMTTLNSALLPHRFNPLSADEPNDTIDHMAITAAANLTLLKSQFDDKTGVRADNETIYYSIMSIRSDIKDIMAVISSINEVVGNIGKYLIHDPSESSSFGAIFSMAARANGVLGLLCHQFSDDDHARPNDDDIYYTIDSLIQCTTDIRRAVKKQQA